MQHSGSISHIVEVHKGKAPGSASEPVQHQPDVLHRGVLAHGHMQIPLTAGHQMRVFSSGSFCLLSIHDRLEYMFCVSIMLGALTEDMQARLQRHDGMLACGNIHIGRRNESA